MIFGVSLGVLAMLVASFVCGTLFGRSLVARMEARLMLALEAVPAKTAVHVAATVPGKK